MATDEPGAEALRRLFRAIHVDQHIWAFTESSQDSDKVLEIFIRMNSGGTPLGKSDLLMSMATNQWKGDARKKVNDLMDRLNGPEKKPDISISPAI